MDLIRIVFSRPYNDLEMFINYLIIVKLNQLLFNLLAIRRNNWHYFARKF